MPYLFVCALFLILNPYSLVGPLGYYVALPFAGLAVLAGGRGFPSGVFFCFLACIGIAIVGVFSSAIHDITQFEHLKVALSISVYYLVGVGVFITFRRRVTFDEFLLCALYVGVVNGVVILVQVQVPQFRAVLESFFVASGNIDWTAGFRYRGLASGGGASLSVLSAFMFYVALYLYGIKKISSLMFAISLIVLVYSVFFIGRTGVLLMPIALLLYISSQGFRNFKILIFLVIAGLFFILLGLDYIKAFLIEQYGEGFYRYSLGYFLEGKQGFEDEGTVGMIADFLTTVPRQFPEVLIGYGFYGGSDFYPWTDSGYARMFLSVGFVFGFIFYGCALYIFQKSAHGRRALFLPLVGLLAIAETKEGMMFSGYSSRLLFILMGYWVAQRRQDERKLNDVGCTSVTQQ